MRLAPRRRAGVHKGRGDQAGLAPRRARGTQHPPPPSRHTHLRAPRAITTLTYSPAGAWLFAGTEGGEVVTVNAARRAVQLVHPVASGGIGYTG